VFKKVKQVLLVKPAVSFVLLLATSECSTSVLIDLASAHRDSICRHH
jgi:hypothetical protein